MSGLEFTAMLPYISAGASIGSALMGVQGANQQAAAIKSAGLARKQQAEYRAEQMRVNAGQQRASAQRASIEEKRKGRLAQSRAIALAGAGGGSTADIYGDLAGLGEETGYNALTALYEGENQASLLESGADLELFEGENAYRSAQKEAKYTRQAGYMGALGSLAQAGTSLYSKYAPTPDQVYGPFQGDLSIARYRY